MLTPSCLILDDILFLFQLDNLTFFNSFARDMPLLADCKAQR